MSTDLLTIVERFLSDIVTCRDEVLDEFEPTEEAAVFEAFGELSQYVETAQDKSDLRALSGAIYEIAKVSPTLKGYLLPDEVDAVDKNDLKAKGVSPDLVRKVRDEGEASDFIDSRASAIINELRSFTGEAKQSSPPIVSSQRAADGSSWLSQIVRRFLNQIGNSKS